MKLFVWHRRNHPKEQKKTTGSQWHKPRSTKEKSVKIVTVPTINPISTFHFWVRQES